jgi:hypothetical protein
MSSGPYAKQIWCTRWCGAQGGSDVKGVLMMVPRLLCLSSSDCVAWLLIQRAGANESELKNQKYAQVVIPPHIY